MARFVFSADGHIVEPQTLYVDQMPASMHQYAIRTERQGEYIITFAGHKVIHRFRINPPKEFAGFGRLHLKGTSDLVARLEDLQMDGVDAEILFPTSGLLTFLLMEAEPELACAQIYNDWLNKTVGERTDVYVRAGVLPVRNNFQYTVQEMKRLASMGFSCAMLPSKIPVGIVNYNDPSWDVVFEAAQNLNMVLVCHTGTGREDVRMEKGPGGAVVNYTHQMLDSQESIMYMVGGGILDRYSKVKVAFIESGASWLAGLVERMDEVYSAHSVYVKPKLSMKPSEIVERQIYVSFQFDRACVMSRKVTGTKPLMWGADYPHHEGTFPHSKQVLADLFKDMPDITEQEKNDIIGGNAARVFRLNRSEFLQAAE